MATKTATGGLSRITIVAPRTRMDLALPSDVPLADLLPTLLRYAGEDLADEGVRHGGWSLSRLGGPPLDGGRTAAQLGVRDGEVLYFNPRASAAPEIVFDDVVDAVATATNQRPGTWQVGTTRSFAVLFAGAALAAGAVAALFAGPPQLPGALAALVVSLALLVTAAVLSRAAGDSRTGAVLAMAGLGYAAIGGLLVLAGDRKLDDLASPHVLMAATAVVLFGAVSALAVGDRLPLFLGAVAVAVAVGIGAVLCLAFDIGAAAAAAVVATIAFAALPALPMVSYRLARLPVPSIPTGPDDLKTDTESVDGPQVLRNSERADAFLTGLLWTVSVLVLGGQLVLADNGRLPSVLLCLVLALLSLLRARPFIGRAQRIPVLLAGTVGLGLAAAATFGAGSLPVRLGLILGGLLLAALISLIYGLTVAGKRISPVWGRTLDIVEILLIVALVPLAVWVCGLYGWIVNLRP
ncbi:MULTISPECIES: type VII secretion integral membrane protein EccD [Micromonospora]|uniref:Type VII secretion integral membrane protein EccD n=1 Tax=Micromonospora solifontis TaxID=2487138 RepID=A0ABX9WKL3_9ACTN|nr:MULTISPECIES: type VII secretion integral membrane protein EccD [Micromonospora]NES14807.1 type VII secretion integral membrane protein EccD [Micromonospora sp. PPF5-17B]NES35371.1 type VII secretion integral membrane protein EccD [Micromonospora solifontis]NES56147.1 type VII secretion integral membrane protein EccD [Micromonospora sp. PPF5-6]RNM00865.1 type VII secretion integral membrane protein EccD [Micromonospora solifontis]